MFTYKLIFGEKNKMKLYCSFYQKFLEGTLFIAVMIAVKITEIPLINRILSTTNIGLMNGWRKVQRQNFLKLQLFVGFNCKMHQCIFKLS